MIRISLNKHMEDVTRIALMDSAEGLNDANWSEKDVIAWKNKLSSFHEDYFFHSISIALSPFK